MSRFAPIATIIGIGAFAASAYIRGGTEKSGAENSATSSSPEIFRAALRGAIPLHAGSPGADTIVVFSDYQCPACKVLEQQHSGSASPAQQFIFLQHMPLERIHPQAKWAAALEYCSAGELTHGEAHRRIFALQDSIVSWFSVNVTGG